MATKPTDSPYYQPALDAVQKLATDTGIPWSLQTVPWPDLLSGLGDDLPRNADQPCLLCGKVH